MVGLFKRQKSDAAKILWKGHVEGFFRKPPIPPFPGPSVRAGSEWISSAASETTSLFSD